MEILFVDCCIRAGSSRTLRLAKRYLSHLNGNVTTIDLTENPPLPLNKERLLLKQKLLEQGRFDDPYFDNANAFKKADLLIVAAPVYDHGCPAALKCFIESITQIGLTFSYDEYGRPSTLSNLKKVVYISTSGGNEESHAGYENFREVMEDFFEVHEFEHIFVDGLDIIGTDVEGKLKEAERQIDLLFA